MAHAIATARPTQADVDERLAFADAALALAGHEVTDPELRAILERQARHELTGDEAREAIRRHVQG
ncbi:hypothetical protein [uncultured Leifsonia sp.]|uniref:hypothetical protein n=1 Tax=uncultured Leifsonia sp. TaxID=340359 RepID=UPI0025CC3E1C|nr:hypothetical protein [uncultured Leifsonia sp.]